MSNFNFNDYSHRRPVGFAPTGLNGVFTLDAARSDARRRVVE
jgi:hypothetical protein